MDQPESSGSMTYPAKGTFNRLVYKIPLLLWRLGFGGYLSSPARGGSKMLVITTTGRKSKLPRHTMASYFRVNNKDYVISGWGERSDWVKNILMDPLVTIQSAGGIYSAIAERVTELPEFTAAAKNLYDSGGDSHFEDWLDSLGIELLIEDLVANKDRIYMVGFDQVDQEGPSPLPVNLLWIWAIIFSILAALALYFL